MLQVSVDLRWGIVVVGLVVAGTPLRRAAAGCPFLDRVGCPALAGLHLWTFPGLICLR